MPFGAQRGKKACLGTSFGRTTLMSRKLLVVEADPSTRDLLADALTSWGFSVLTAATGRQALALLVTEAMGSMPIEGVLLDLDINGLDPLTTLRDIRDRHETLPVVIIASAGTGNLAEQATQEGAVAVVRKPVNRSQLHETIQLFFRPGGAMDA
jgi:DNA-binding NtrC family response regulator